ncbi:MAG TPA: dihydrolipoamide acetyltransferase family protein [Solirubrobacteraceae bacterium]|jgi:pyruvate dehydrogenase E2 component (dihydrolipoamide acetyltransferase)|nr:dihydrolipoamide acetyltransferase family protein [Solirubrobacteraceae bacterium]
MAELVMPRLSDTMEEGTILRWLKADGEHVARGEELVEIETDKAAMVYESDQDGILETVAAEGDTLPVGAVIAHVGDASQTDAVAPAPASVPTSTPAAASTPSSTQTAAPSSAAGTTEPPRFADALPAAPPPTSDGERVKASPLARRIAAEQGVDLHTLSGSGPGGRIVKADVEGAIGAAPAGGVSVDGETEAAPAPSAGAAPIPAREDVSTAKGQTTTHELSRMQQTIARRMAESKATIPDFTLQSDVDMEACVALRGELKRISSQDAPTYNDMVVKAAALALREYPRANGSYKDGALQLHSRVNVGVAVAAQDALVVPTVFDADEKSLGEIAREARALAARVRDGSITPPELGGGTFTVSNLGMYGIKSFSAIINPPQAAILSVGSVEQRAVVRNGELSARHTMTLTLVCDHRILYGADAAELLARIRELLQTPASLTL